MRTFYSEVWMPGLTQLLSRAGDMSSITARGGALLEKYL